MASSYSRARRSHEKEGGSDDEGYPSSAASIRTRRRSYYDSQRIGPRSRGNSMATDKNPPVIPSSPAPPLPQQPQHYPTPRSPTRPPVPGPSESQEKTYRRSAFLEDTHDQWPLRTSAEQPQRHSGGATSSASNRRPSGSSRKYSTHSQKPSGSSDRGQQDLSEVAAPPPVPDVARDPGRGSAGTRQAQPSAPAGDPGDVQEEQPESSHPAIDLDGVSPDLTELYTISYLIFFSFWGTLARLGVQWLAFYPGAPVVTPVIWANMAGSAVLGFLSEDQALFQDAWTTRPPQRQEDPAVPPHNPELNEMDKAERMKKKKAIPLYIGLATGFCGSFTSFSSFARDFFLALSNDLPTPIDHPYPLALAVSTSNNVARNGGYSFLAFLGVVILTMALSLGGLIAGAHLALALENVTPRISKRLTRRILDPLFVFLAFACWLGALFLVIWPPDRPGGSASRGSWDREVWRGEVLFALVFAPLGCLLRFYISLYFNGLVLTFPLGTFVVNMFGTAVEGMCYDVQHVGVGAMGLVGGGLISCQALQGFMDGFCGCLTTVSTWVAEINGLKRKYGYVYAFTSIIGAMFLLLIIMGSVRWSVGFSDPVCNTGYTGKIYG